MDGIERNDDTGISPRLGEESFYLRQDVIDRCLLRAFAGSVSVTSHNTSSVEFRAVGVYSDFEGAFRSFRGASS